MKLGEILDLLVSSELANLAYVENNQIVESKIPNIVNAINLGLIKLYTRFKLRKDYLFLNVSSTIDTYELITSKTVSGNNVGAYILDTDNPYTGNLLEVLTVVSSDGVGYNLDGSDGLCLLKTNTLKFTSTPTTAIYTVEYLALPDKVVYVNSTDIEVNLPDAYISALLYFIASRFMSPVGISFDANRSSMDVNYIQRYEAECQQLESKGIDIDLSLDNSLFYQRGFI